MYRVLAYELKRHDRIYFRGEVHDFAEWPDEARAKDLQEALGAGLIEALEPGAADEAEATPAD
jgi:hypothetical protein